MPRAKTKAEQAIEEKLRELPEGSERHTVLLSAQRFKSSWVELGQRLGDVLGGKLFEDWGYPSFDAYCRQEIRIKKATAIKLTQSFGFMQEHEPEALRSQGPLPDLETVSVLSQARENPYLSEKDYRELRDAVFSGAQDPNSLRKELRERAPQAFVEPPFEPDEQRRRLVQKVARLADQLYELLLNADLLSPGGMADFEAALGEIRTARDEL